MPGHNPEIIDEQTDFWVINKPSGWTVQRDEQAQSVLQWLLDETGQKGFPVHRLDKPTTGILLVAKTTEGNRQLSKAFADKRIEKVYVAVADQKPRKKQGWVKGDMAVSRRSQWKLLRSTENPAITQFTSEAISDGYRGYILHPKTGKTHQLRVAMKSLGSPILGDKIYGGTESERLYLHAWKIKFELNEQTFEYQINPVGGWFDQWPEKSADQ